MSGVTVILDEVTPLLERVRSAAQARGLAMVGGRAVGTLLRDYLVDLNSDRHRYGRNFFAQAARSVTVNAVANGAAVSVTKTGFRQRLLGGTITAGSNGSGKKFLTIPADGNAEAHQETAAEMNDLQLAKRVNPKTGHLQWCLIQNASTPISILHRRQKDGTIKTTIKAHAAIGGEVVFWLVHSVNQKPDPGVLPRDEQMNAVAVRAIGAEIDTQARRAGSAGGTN